MHLTFSLHNGTKSLSPDRLIVHSLNMSILCLKNKVSYHETDEMPFHASKAEATQYSTDTRFSLEEMAHFGAVHQHMGEAVTWKAAQFWGR